MVDYALAILADGQQCKGSTKWAPGPTRKSEDGSAEVKARSQPSAWLVSMPGRCT